MKLFTLRLNLLLLLLVAFFDASANSFNTNSSFESAIIAFKSGDYHKARRLFLEAEAENYHSEKLYYNLGVVNYKLGYYPSSQAAFEKLLNSDSLKQIAMYNLGLIEIKLENHERAIYWLNQCIEQPDNNNIQIIATSLLQKLDVAPAPLASKNFDERFRSVEQKALVKRGNNQTSFNTIISTQFGYNDNVAQYRYIREITNQNGEDSFVEFQADSTLRQGKHIAIFASFNDLQYQQNEIYDTSSLLFGTSYKNNFNWLNYLLEVNFLRQTINSREFQFISRFSASLQKNLLDKILYSMRFTQEYISPQNRIYHYLEGVRQLWSNTLDLYLYNTVVSLSYEFESNNRQDFFSGNERYISFSPRSHTLGINLQQKFRKNLETAVFGKFIYVYYPTADVVSENFKRHRNDISNEYGAALYYRLLNNIILTISYHNISNDSNLSRYRFENNLYRAGVKWNF